jgi:Family of unknown function (DUF6588)
MKKIFITTVIILFSFSLIHAQDLNQTLSNLSEDAAKAYVAPIVSGFGADLNSGWVHRIPKAEKFGFDLEITIVGMGTFFGDANKTFSSSGNFRFNQDQAYNMTSDISNPNARDAIVNQIISTDFQVGIGGPTVVGAKDQNVVISFPGKTFTYNSQDYTVPAQDIVLPVTGYLGNISLMPLAAPQISLGTVYGTSLELRFLPSMQISSDLGNFSYFGIGFQHNPAVWFDDLKLPVDLSVDFYTQTLKVGTIFKSSATMFGINAGRTFGWSMLNVTPYAGLSFESSTITVNYVQTVDTQTGPEDLNISFDLKGENSARFTIGAAFKLAIINLNIDYSLAKYNSASVGLGFVF